MAEYTPDGAKLKTFRAYGLSMRGVVGKLRTEEELRMFAAGLQGAIDKGIVQLSNKEMRKLQKTLNARLKVVRVA